MLKSKSSMALIIGIILVLSLIALWYVTPVPTVSPLIVSDLENLDAIATMEGTVKGFAVEGLYHVSNLSIRIEAHVYTEEVKGDNIILRIDSNIIRADTNEILTDFSGNSTYVFNKLTRENVKDAPEANKPREGYDPFYPSHIKRGEDIPNAWLDNLNETGTLEFKGIVVEEDVELYEYFVNKTIITKKVVIPPLYYDDYTLTSTKTVLIEPLSGIPVYTKNETFIIVGNQFITFKNRTESKTLVYVTYKDKEMDLATPRLAHGAMQLLEFDKEVKGWILGAIIVILTVAFIFNTRSLSRARKMPPQTKT